MNAGNGATAFGWAALATEDFNGDGRADLAATDARADMPFSNWYELVAAEAEAAVPG